MNPRLPLLALILSICAGIAACGPLMGGLRRDLDDEAFSGLGGTYGGPLAESGFLAQSMGEAGYNPERYGTVGHSERAPASLSGPAADAQGSWVSSGRGGLSQSTDPAAEGAEDPALANGTFGGNDNVLPQTKRLYKNGVRATRADFIDESPNEGSLWASDGQTNYYFTKNKIRGVGDILTINLEDEIVKDMRLEVKRKLTQTETEREITAAQALLRKKILSGEPGDGGPQSGDRQAAAKAEPDNKKDPLATTTPVVPEATAADIDLSKSLEIQAGDKVLAEIVERYANGNYRIRGSKRVPYKNGAPRLMTVMGVVRGSDIGEDDIINSGRLYEYRLEALR